MSEGVTHEIITLQIGNYANYIGAHYFNIQDPALNPNTEVDPGILWRQVLNQQRNPIWTPRVLIFDLKDNYYSRNHTSTHFPSQSQSPSTQLSQTAQSSASEESNARGTSGLLWDGPVKYVDLRHEPENNERQESGKTPGVSASEMRGASEINSGNTKGSEVKSWLDYTRWKLHWSAEKASEVRFSLPNFSHNPNSTVVSNYGKGLQIYTDLEDKITDAIRRYTEPCDYFQGFHIVADQEDAFGGLASGILQHIGDEYDKKTSFCFGVSRPTSSSLGPEGKAEQFEDFKLRTLNTSLTWNSFGLHSSVFTSLGLADDLFAANPQPVHLPHLNYNPHSDYESSAVLAAALDTLTMPYRLKSSRINFSQVVGLLNGYGHKMTMVGSCFPFPLLNRDSTLFDTLKERGLDDLRSLTPGVSLDLDKSIGNFFVPRGFSVDRVIRRAEERRRGGGWQEAKGQTDDGIVDAESCLEVYAQETCRKSVNVVRSIVSPFRLSHPFPVLFPPDILQSLNKSPAPSTPASSARPTSTSATSGPNFVYETPAIASAHNTRGVGDLLQKLVDVEMNSKKNLAFSRSVLAPLHNIEQDDYQECLDNLRVLRETYEVDM